MNAKTHKNFTGNSRFGMNMEKRNFVTTYRYHYNSMEMDAEVSGSGNSYTTEFRQYDPRLGRWKSLDPLMAQFPWMSPYVAFDNNPIYFVDPLGLAAEGKEGDKEKSYRNPEKRAKRWADRMVKKGKIEKDYQISTSETGNVNIQYSWKTDNKNGTRKSKDENGEDINNLSTYTVRLKTFKYKNDGFGSLINVAKITNDHLGNGTFLYEQATYHRAGNVLANKVNPYIFATQIPKNSQQYRIAKVTGTGTGMKVFKVVKGVGVVTTYAAPILTGVDIINKETDGDPYTNSTTKDYVDLTVTTVGAAGTAAAAAGVFGLASNPIGWGCAIGLGIYGIASFLYDCSGSNIPAYVPGSLPADVQFERDNTRVISP